MMMSWDAVTPEQYDGARETVHWEGDPAAGGMFHMAAFDGQRLRVTDLWESAEDFQRFVEGWLMPGIAQLGISGEPQVEVYPAHRIFANAYTPKG